MPMEGFNTADSKINKDTANGIEGLVDKRDFENFKDIAGGAKNNAASKTLERDCILPQLTIEDSSAAPESKGPQRGDKIHAVPPPSPERPDKGPRVTPPSLE